MTYYISCVTMDKSGSFIASVGVSTAISPATEIIAKAEVLRRMGLGNEFHTISKVAGIWKLGAKVEPVQVGSEWFLRTDHNKTKVDNLGVLPSC